MSDLQSGNSAQESRLSPSDPLALFAAETASSSMIEYLRPSPGSKPLSAEDQKTLMRKVQDLTESEEEHESEDVEMGDEEVEPVVDLKDQLRRTEKLNGILSTLAQLWWADSDQLDFVVEKLADGCRNCKFFRLNSIFSHIYMIEMPFCSRQIPLTILLREFQDMY
jgi:hypothetical protein